METTLSLFELVKQAVQWLIIPIIMAWWLHERRLSQHDADIIKMLTILDERNKQADERNRRDAIDQSNHAEAVLKLHEAIERLTTRIDKLADKDHR